MKNQWTVKLKEDKITGDCILPFPKGLIKQLAWRIGDKLSFEQQDDGTILVKNICIPQEYETILATLTGEI